MFVDVVPGVVDFADGRGDFKVNHHKELLVVLSPKIQVNRTFVICGRIQHGSGG